MKDNVFGIDAVDTKVVEKLANQAAGKATAPKADLSAGVTAAGTNAARLAACAK